MTHNTDIDALPVPSGRLFFAFHWFMWKIGKALYPPGKTWDIPPEVSAP